MEKLLTFKRGDLKIEMFYVGTDKVPNKVYIDDVLVQDDDTYRPSPMFDIDSTDSVMSLIGFLLLREDDVEAEFFEGRDERLAEWAESSDTADELRLVEYDWSVDESVPEWLETCIERY